MKKCSFSYRPSAVGTKVNSASICCTDLYCSFTSKKVYFMVILDNKIRDSNAGATDRKRAGIRQENRP